MIQQLITSIPSAANVDNRTDGKGQNAGHHTRQTDQSGRARRGAGARPSKGTAEKYKLLIALRSAID